MPPLAWKRLRRAIVPLNRLALPTEAHQSANINDIARSLGEFRPIDPKRLFGVAPKPGAPPENRTAASTGIEGGGKAEDQNAGERLLTFYRACPIIATHFGIEVLP